MFQNSYTTGQSMSPMIGRARDVNAPARWEADLSTKLKQWFDTDFKFVDGNTGKPLRSFVERGTVDWDLRGELCRAVSSRGLAEFIEDESPLLVMALPIELSQRRVVALGTFAISNSVTESQLAHAGAMLGLEPDDARQWIASCCCWNADVLLRMGQLASEQIAATQRMKSLEREVHGLSANLSTTYEEISLLYRLTQNLKLSAKDEELGQLALAWLSDVLPAEALAIYFVPDNNTPSLNREVRGVPLVITQGPCPLGSEQLGHLVDHYRLAPGQRPLIVNQPTTLATSWAWPAVREFIMVPLAEGNNCFGWLIAINHAEGGEFGTVEASLLNSVGAILGIHCGNAQLYNQQQEFFAGVVRALTSAIDAKDPYTCGHSDRVARVAVRLAEEMGCTREQLDTIYLSGLLHDVGKIGIDDNVLRKPGKLTEAEYEHIKTHAEIGYRILSDIKQLDEVLPVVRHHHEQWDGKGYPHGLIGEEIPFLARIVAVADSFDAMGSDRPYRQGLAEEKLDEIMRDGAGKQWDAAVVAAFFNVRVEIREIARQKVKSLTLDLPEFG